MNILVIDSMGGGIGKAVIQHLCTAPGDVTITAVGTNSIATSAMLKAGADYGATGENAVIYNAANADYIIGVIGIVFANSLHGEISPQMANAVATSPAHKILIPTDKCNVTVLGSEGKPIQALLDQLVKKISFDK